MTIYAVVENDQITEIHHSLPINWRNVSGFNHIDDETILESYGWYIVTENIPEYDNTKYYLSDPSFVVNKTTTITVEANYELIQIPFESPSELQRRFLILVRDTRNNMLTNSDWTMLYDVIKTKNSEWVMAWESYRQQLREYPNQFNFAPEDIPPDFNSLVWPEKPSG